MHLINFPDASQFLNRAQHYLEAREAHNSLMLGTCLRLASHPEWITKAPYLATVEKGVLVHLAAMLTPPFNLVLASHQHELNSALQLVTDDLLAHNWSVPGITASKSLARSFAEFWVSKTGCRYDLEMAQRIYECRGVIPPSMYLVICVWRQWKISSWSPTGFSHSGKRRSPRNASNQKKCWKWHEPGSTTATSIYGTTICLSLWLQKRAPQ